MPKPVFPTVHMNGTSKEALIALHLEAITALRVALNAVEATAPNGRDFYTQGEAAMNEAIAQHRARTARVSAVMEEITDIAMAIRTQKGGR